MGRRHSAQTEAVRQGVRLAVCRPKRKSPGFQRVGRIKERSDADPALVLARHRIRVQCRIGASLDSAYFECPDNLLAKGRLFRGLYGILWPAFRQTMCLSQTARCALRQAKSSSNLVKVGKTPYLSLRSSENAFWPTLSIVSGFLMTMDRSLKVQAGAIKTRNVLSRAERVARLQELDRFNEEASVIGMPKVRVVKVSLKKKKKVKKEDGDVK